MRPSTTAGRGMAVRRGTPALSETAPAGGGQPRRNVQCKIWVNSKRARSGRRRQREISDFNAHQRARAGGSILHQRPRALTSWRKQRIPTTSSQLQSIAHGSAGYFQQSHRRGRVQQHGTVPAAMCHRKAHSSTTHIGRARKSSALKKHGHRAFIKICNRTISARIWQATISQGPRRRIQGA